jgi:HSP20 family protein
MHHILAASTDNKRRLPHRHLSLTRPINHYRSQFTQLLRTPAAEIVRDGEDAVVRVELPGVDVAKDVNVEVERGHLVIHGERRDERSEEKDGRTLREVRYGSFRRSFKLPAHITSEAISASYDAGVLTVRVTGAHKGAEAQRIAIESK